MNVIENKNILAAFTPEFSHLNDCINLFSDQINTGSVAGDLETGTPVPQEVPENVQVEKWKNCLANKFGSSNSYSI
jgi:hypothetical protein